MTQPETNGSTILAFAEETTAIAPRARLDTGSAPSKETSYYRSDVDGLRALAVIPVVLFHAGFRFMSGGFVGVDVFFVISGFLITGILAREISEGRYSILQFYRRRARRIFPALTAVAVATLAGAYFIVTPGEYVELAKSVVAVSIFSSNIYFWKSVSYFQNANEFRPMLHTWSLAVEEQYYVFFPLLLRLLHLRRRGLVASLWLICFASLALAVALVPWKPNAAFYLLPTRAWELMIGGILAVARLPKPSGRNVASVSAFVGLVLISGPMFIYTATTPFPGLAAVPPALGTALVIWANGEGVIANILSERAVVAVGKASYSIYLWHVPLLAFAVYLVAGPLSTGAALLLCLASIALGFVSLVLVERPFRSRASGRTPNKTALIAAGGMVLIALMSLLVIGAKGFPDRMSPAEATLIAAADDKYRHHAECMTVDRKEIQPGHACHLGAPGVAPSVLLWGDSHSMVTATALEQAALRAHASFLFAADADCPPGLGFAIDPRFDPGVTRQLSYRYCAEYNQRMLDVALTSPGIRTVVISARWTNWRIGEPANPAESEADIRLRDEDGTAASALGNRQKWERGFVALLNRLTAAGKKVVIIGPVPEPSFDVPHRLYVQRFGFSHAMQSITKSDYDRRHRTILQFFDQIRGRPGLTFIWPARSLCQADTCPIVEQGHPLFLDEDHLSVYGAKKTAPLYDILFRNSS